MAYPASRAQAKRLFGLVAAGVRSAASSARRWRRHWPRPSAITISVDGRRGFAVTAPLVHAGRRKQRPWQPAPKCSAPASNIGSGNAFDGFVVVALPLFVAGGAVFATNDLDLNDRIFPARDLITMAFKSREARTQVYAMIDLAVNGCAVFIQLFGTGRFIARFGVGAGLLLNPIIMVIAFIAMAFSPVLMVLGGIQIFRRVAEYAVAKPTREMLFTVVDQESRYKAKNVIDTVVYRFGDQPPGLAQPSSLGVTGWRSSGQLFRRSGFDRPFLGKRYETVRAADIELGVSVTEVWPLEMILAPPSIRELQFFHNNSTGSIDIDVIPMTVFAGGHVVAVAVTLCVYHLVAR
jgi:AAA family ATP:ADP antiporter